MNKKTLLTLAAFFCTAVLLASPGKTKTYIPELIPLPIPEKPLLKADEIVIDIPDIGVYPIGKELKRTSLQGLWKFSGMESAELPFSQQTPEVELPFAAADFDDSQWDEIKVPTNWWTTEKWNYRKIFRPSRKTNIKGQAYNQRTSNPYCKGWYRKAITLPAKITGQVLLEFHAIGYEANLYVNGEFFDRLHGDFCTNIVNITPLVKPGKNVIAMRFLADLGPHDEVATHVYGAAWSNEDIKGGLWDHVYLLEDSSVSEISKMKLVPDSAGNLAIHYEILYSGEEPLIITPGVAVSSAMRDSTTAQAHEFAPVTLKKGVNTGVLELQEKDVQPWTPNAPNLYFASLYFKNGNDIYASRIERFGFRDFKIKGNQFYLNGKPIFLAMDTAQSMMFSGDKGDPWKRVADFRQRGVVILRTAHQPVTPRLYDVADELGMLIYDEWAPAFTRDISEDFENNVLEEMVLWMNRDHNHPSVVLWCLGNEIQVANNKALHAFLKKQVKIAREIDMQKRPVIAFSGFGNVGTFGRLPLDTDVIDFHIYTGVMSPWGRWDREFQDYYNEAAKIYGNKEGVIEKPIIITEAIGGGWGLSVNKKYQHGNIDEYLEIMKRPFHWGMPGATGYSGVVGVKNAYSYGCRYIHNLIGTRLVEMARQDPRIAGFGYWCGLQDLRQLPRWSQPVYPGLRVSPEHRYMPRHFFPGQQLELNAFVLNQGIRDLADVTMKITLAANQQEFAVLSEIPFGNVASGERKAQNIILAIPENVPADTELRLTLYDAANTDCGRNSYAIRLHSFKESTAPVKAAGNIVLAYSHPATEQILKDLQIAYTILDDKTALNAAVAAVIIPPGKQTKFPRAGEIDEYVTQGGRLLILEQGEGEYPIVKGLFTVTDANSRAEVVIEKHPLFKNMTLDDFDIWGENPEANVVTNILPLDITALAVKGRFLIERGAGNAISEAVYGRGRILASQLDATHLWKHNSAATRYLRNLFDYAVSNGRLYPDARKLEDVALSLYPIAHERVFHVDLKKHVNTNFRDDIKEDGKGGWLDQGENDYRNIPLGIQQGAGIPFLILDADKNDGRSCIIMKSAAMPKVAWEITGIEINRKMMSLFFLHTAANGGATTERFAEYHINYEDGTKAVFPVVGTININDWWKPVYDMRGAIPCMIQKNPFGYNIGFYASRWINPHPEKTIRSLDIVSDEKIQTTVIVAAITGELIHEAPLLLTADAVRELKGDSVSLQLQKNAVRIHHTGKAEATATLKSLDEAKFRNNTYDYISFRYRSNAAEDMVLELQQYSGSSALRTQVQLEDTKGEWRYIRLHLREEFKLRGFEFDIHDMKREIALTFVGNNNDINYIVHIKDITLE